MNGKENVNVSVICSKESIIFFLERPQSIEENVSGWDPTLSAE